VLSFVGFYARKFDGRKMKQQEWYDIIITIYTALIDIETYNQSV